MRAGESPRPSTPDDREPDHGASAPIRRPLAPQLDPDEQRDLDARLEEHGVSALAQRMEDSRRLSFAREVIDDEICRLADEHLIVERDLLLGGSSIPYTLLSGTGAYAVVPIDCAADDATVVEAILRDMPALKAIVGDLRSLVSSKDDYTIKVVFLCPYTDEPPRPWYRDGGEAWIVGGMAQFKSWLSEQLTTEGADTLALLRERAKPRARAAGRSIRPTAL